jgi:hypothetical protein
MSNPVVSILLSMFLIPLSSAQKTKPQAQPVIDGEEYSRVIDECDRLCLNYLKGDIDHARESLQSAIRLAEHDVWLPRPDYQAQVLWLDYARLCALERRAGNDVLAEGYLVKARYWQLRMAELKGDSIEAAANYVVKQFPVEKVMALVEKADNANTDGRGPAYIQSLLTATSRPVK